MFKLHARFQARRQGARAQRRGRDSDSQEDLMLRDPLSARNGHQLVRRSISRLHQVLEVASWKVPLLACFACASI